LQLNSQSVRRQLKGIAMTEGDVQFDRVGKFGRILAGSGLLLLGVIAALSALVAGIQVLESPRLVARWIVFGLSVALTWACLLFAYRLLLNRPRSSGGLLSPLALRLSALFFGGLPLLGFVTGAWRTSSQPKPWLIVQGVGYFLAAISLWRLARQRSARAATKTEA
jgi:hypothetical protein